MSSAPHPNHRRERRLTARRSTRVICFKGPLGLGQNLALGAKDVSEGGICLVLAEALPVGQEVEIHLESLQHRRPIKIPGVVVWCRPTDAGPVHVGVRFEKLLPYRELQALAQLG